MQPDHSAPSAILNWLSGIPGNQHNDGASATSKHRVFIVFPGTAPCLYHSLSSSSAWDTLQYQAQPYIWTSRCACVNNEEDIVLGQPVLCRSDPIDQTLISYPKVNFNAFDALVCLRAYELVLCDLSSQCPLQLAKQSGALIHNR